MIMQDKELEIHLAEIQQYLRFDWPKNLKKVMTLSWRICNHL